VLCAKAASRYSNLNLRKKLMKCYLWNINMYGAEAWTLFGKSIRNTLKVFKCFAGEGWIRSLVPITWKTKTYGIESRRKERCYIQKTNKHNWIGNILRRNCLLRYVIEGKAERQRRKTTYSYWMTSRKREGTGI
jgi:hypothetical protein